MKCKYCGVKDIKGQAKSYCSMECKSKSQLKLKELRCSICGNVVKVKRSRKDAKFCSIKCKYVWWKTREIPESTRNKLSKALSGKPKSEEHKQKIRVMLRKNIRRGEDNYFWKGGVTKLNQQIRSSLSNKEWRKKIFERDDYTCQICLKRGVYVEADHIKPFSNIINENNIRSMEDAEKCNELWDIGNGRTLCRDCHKNTDTYMGRTKKHEKESS